MGDLLAAAAGAKKRVSAADLSAMLRDHAGHPFSIYRHGAPADPPYERYETVASIVMETFADRTLRIASGPPCESPYETFRLE